MNGLLPDGTKLLPDPMFCGIHLKTISPEMLINLIRNMCSKITFSDYCHTPQGAVSIRKTVLPGMAIPMLKIRRPNGRLIFNMEITIRR